MSARQKGRKRALDILYAADLRHEEVTAVLEAEASRQAEKPEQAQSFGFARELIEAIIAHQAEIDQLITQTSTAWPLERMPIIDRSVLRLGTGELMTMPDTPSAVIISEAGGLAAEYSTDESRGFVQGVLGTIAETLRGEPPREGR